MLKSYETIKLQSHFHKIISYTFGIQKKNLRQIDRYLIQKMKNVVLTITFINFSSF